MNRIRNISIRAKIFGSFFLLVFMFILNGLITFKTLRNYKQSSNYFSNVTDPSLQKLGELNNMLIGSKVYTTSWVFLRSNQDDKASLLKIHTNGYKSLKSNLDKLSSQWREENWIDSLQNIYTGFEALLTVEKKIIRSLNEEEDYDNAETKSAAEQMVESKIIPHSIRLISSLSRIIDHQQDNRIKEEANLVSSTIRLRILILVLTLVIISIGILLSIYMTRLIVNPMERIRHIINNIGNGITEKIEGHHGKDEIGKMVMSVNNLSERIRTTAAFADEIGNRNFNAHFSPLSDEDTLGKALITMRDSLKQSDERLNQAQHIAHIGSWERNIKTDKLIYSDEMFRIFDIDPLQFDFQFPSIVEYIHPDDREYMKRITKENQYLPPVPYECRIVTSKGVIKNIWVETKVILGKHGEIEKTFGIVQDITERKRAENKLTEERELFRLVIENLPDQVYLKDTESRFILCNQPVVANAGYASQADIVGKTDFDFLPLSEAKKYFIDEQNIMESGIPIMNYEEHSVNRKTGEASWSLSTKLPVKNNAGELIGLVGINHDITERVLLEARLNEEKTKKQQEINAAIVTAQSQERSLLGEELHDNINQILATANLYMDGALSNEESRMDFLKEGKCLIKSAMEEIRKLSKTLLPPSLGEIGLRKSLCDVIEKIKLVNDNINFVIDWQIPDENNISEKLRLTIFRIIQEQLNNIFKHAKASNITICLKEEMQTLEISIRDDGKGFDTNEKRNGIGLQNIIHRAELLDGNISINSKPGAGCELTITFPFKSNKKGSFPAEHKIYKIKSKKSSFTEV
ncbi:MAG: PAS domain S-box protein [Ginsengibacter sp.]